MKHDVLAAFVTLVATSVPSTIFAHEYYHVQEKRINPRQVTTCATDGSDYVYTETISSDGNTRSIVTTWCPNHPYTNINPNYPIKTETTYRVPAKPIYTGRVVADLTEQGGVVGVMFSGAMIYSPYGGPNYGRVTSQANSATPNEGDTFDQCGGHASSTTESSYHYHVAPPCLLQQLGQSSGSHSPQIGWAADGFPVYGPYGPSGTKMQTCTVTGGTFGTDVCTNDQGGYLRTDSSIDEFTFRYYFIGETNDGLQCSNIASTTPFPGSDETTYPNTPTGYYGCCPSGVSCSASFLSSCGSGDTTAGYTFSTATAKYPTGLSCNSNACGSSCSSSSSTPAPTAAPTCSCFSESATVQVHNEEEPVVMKDLKVGQEIFAGLDEDSKPIFETVYGFAHHDEDRIMKYLRINTTASSGTNSSLEISSNHLIFVKGQKDPIPAGSLQVGDVLLRQSIDERETQYAAIVSIEKIQRRGLYAPLTKDGTVIVDGIHASSYVSINHLVPQVIGNVKHRLLMSEQTFFHWWMSPYRIFCTHLAPQLCVDDYSNEDEGGYIHWLVVGRKLAELVQGTSSNVIIFMGLSVVAAFCGIFMIVENLLEKPFSFWFLQIACACFLWRRLKTPSKYHQNKREVKMKKKEV